MTVPSVYTLNAVAEKIKAGEWDAWVDTLPVGFTFTNQNNVGQSAVITSNIITVAGLAAATNVSVSGGTNSEISIDGGAWVTSGTINNGQSLQARTTSASSVLITNNVVVTLGAFTTTWQVSTGSDFSPNTFSFTNVTVDPSTLTTSNTLTLTGFNSPSRISVTGTGAAISINGGAFVTSGDIRDGQTLQVRLTSNATENGTASATITLGTYSTTWTVTSVSPAIFVDDIFAPTPYTGNGTAQTITTGIDLLSAGTGNLMQGGLIWTKRRNTALFHSLIDTVRGNTYLDSSSTGVVTTSTGQINTASGITISGYSVGNNSAVNAGGDLYVSWNFRRAKKFFDIVQYTGTGSVRTITHNLGSVPGFIIIKRTDNPGNWIVYHQSVEGGMGPNCHILLNSTAARVQSSSMWGSTAPTASVFTVGTDANVNASGGTYIAYFFAHETDANGLVQCGYFNTSGGAATVDIGWEPQFLLVKYLTGAEDWRIIDEFRGWTVDGGNAVIAPNTTAAETSGTIFRKSPTGFIVSGALSSAPYIYMAIRRGPMRVPTDATKVFKPQARTGNGTTSRQLTGIGFPPDLGLYKSRNNVSNWIMSDRLRGASYLSPNQTAVETASALVGFTTFLQDGAQLGTDNSTTDGGNQSTSTYVDYFLRRASGFFEQVCYAGDGVAGRTVGHNLRAVPTMIWAKARSVAGQWCVYHSQIPASQFLYLNQTNAAAPSSMWNSVRPTSSAFSLGGPLGNNNTNTNHIAYIFGDVPGVSKAFSYTGNGNSQTISLGFAPRFILIKRTDAVGDWYMWDTARGIIASSNDPYSMVNSTNAEVTTNNSIDPAAGGFIANQVTASNINVNSAAYIGYAIA